MTAQLDASAVEQILERAGVDLGTVSATPFLLLDADLPSIVWANALAVSLLGVAQEREASRRLFRSGPSSRALINRISRMAAGPEPRLERLMISHGFTITPHTVACRAVRDGDSEPLILVQFLQPSSQDGSAAPQFASALSAEPGGQTEPIAPEDASLAAPAQSGPASVIETAHRLTSHSAGHRVLRILWETDAAGLVTQVGREFAEAVGSSALTVGEEIVARLQKLDRGVGEAIGSALADKRTAMGLRVQWPIAGVAAAVLVEIGCVQRNDATPGLRGFCLIHIDRLMELVEHRVEDLDASRAPNSLNTPGSGPASESPEPLRISDAADAVADGSDARTDLLDAAAAGGPASDNVVRFPIVKGLPVVAADEEPADLPRSVPPEVGDSTSPLDPPLWSESPATDQSATGAAPGHLSLDEQDAFEHIRKVLGTGPFAEGMIDQGVSTREDGKAEPATAPDTPRESSASTLLERSADLRLLDSLPIGVMLQRNNKMIHINVALRERLGLTDHEKTPTNTGLVLFDPDEVREDRAGRLTIMLTGADGQRLNGEIQTVAFDGEPATLSTFELRTDPVSGAASSHDVEAVDVGSSEKDAVLSLVSDGIGFIDGSGVIRFATPGAQDLFGYGSGDLVGQPAASLLMAGQEPAWRALLARAAMSHMSATEGDLLGRTRSGNLIPLHVRIGRVAADKFCVMWADDSSRKRAENGLEAARREADRANALKSEFLAKVSHEIRTPLNAILGFAEVIMDERLGPVGNSRYVEYLKDIHASGTHVMSLVNDLLDLSRIEAGRLDLKLEAVDANTVVSACVNTLQTQAHRERVIVRLSLAPHLPPVLADERSLRQIVLNLLSNAVKFNEPGGQVIVSTALTEAETVAIRIRDTGLGMSEQDVETAMEPFRQLPTAKSSSGSGLGLPLTKALVEASCASMTIKSRPGEGTLVEVVFPVVEQQTLSVPAE